jgi:sorbitol/mannitol transport system substrate-binding protein
VPLDDLSEEYDVDDILPAMRAGLSYDGTLYAAPFYGESSMVMYRTDLMEKAGLEMPDAPTWDFIREAAAAMTDKDNEINGICLRGKAGWGEAWRLHHRDRQLVRRALVRRGLERPVRSARVEEALTFFVDLMNESGPPGAATNGFNENLSLFQQGKCGMWIDATVAASFVTNPNDSTVADKVGFALAPTPAWASAPTGSGPGLWRFPPVPRRKTPPKSSSNGRPRRTTSSWSPKEGWANVPPGSADLALRESEVPEGAVRQDDARFHQRGRSEQSDRRPGALCRHPVRRDSRICRHRAPRSARSSRLSMPVSRPLKKRSQRRRR